MPTAATVRDDAKIDLLVKEREEHRTAANRIQGRIDALSQRIEDRRQKQLESAAGLDYLIDFLSESDPTAQVSCRGRSIDGVDVTRQAPFGLSLSTTDVTDHPFTVETLRIALRDTLGTSLENYKGYNFTPAKDTLIWLDAWSEPRTHVITGARRLNGHVVLTVKEID